MAINSHRYVWPSAALIALSVGWTTPALAGNCRPYEVERSDNLVYRIPILGFIFHGAMRAAHDCTPNTKTASVIPTPTCATDPVLCPPPPKPIVTKTFIVFFDFDKSNLTEPNLAIVEEAVRTAKENGFVKVLVTGHTDTVGSDSYNMALSIRRAQSVKDEMVREGMDGGGVEIVGKSFHDLRNPTGPGVRDDQNRRAVIDLGG